jgi:hypothetical protein
VSILVVILTLALLAAVMAVVSAPLRAVASTREGGERGRAELEAARESKYREIRDLELDYRTGKLSVEDYQATGGTLRAEALEILNRLEAIERASGAQDGEGDGEG